MRRWAMEIESVRIWRMIAALVLVPAPVFVESALAQRMLAADDPALEQYLNRLGLTELRLTYFERLLERETAPAKRAQHARTLANSYAEEMAASSEEPERFARWK